MGVALFLVSLLGSYIGQLYELSLLKVKTKIFFYIHIALLHPIPHLHNYYIHIVVVKIKFGFSIRTTAVERVNRCCIEPVLPQNGDCKTTVAPVLRPRNGAVSIKIAVLRPLVTPYNG